LAEGQSREDLVLTYRAATLLYLLTGWDCKKVWRALQELGFKASLDDIRRWLHSGDKPFFTPTALEKSLYYHVAYKLVLATAAEHPDWGLSALLATC